MVINQLLSGMILQVGKAPKNSFKLVLQTFSFLEIIAEIQFWSENYTFTISFTGEAEVRHGYKNGEILVCWDVDPFFFEMYPSKIG